MIEKAFNIVCEKVEAALAPQGFAKQKVETAGGDEMVALFTGESVAYSVVYYVDKMHMVMRTCAMTEDGPDNEWKSAATWMFNPDVDTEKEAASIGNDFADIVSSPVALKRSKQQKKKKASDDGNADPLFFAKRFVKYFPELKDEIKEETDCYYPFRGVTFAKEKILPKLNAYLATATQKETDKLSQLLSTQYRNGDMDTRAIVTIIILNNIDQRFHSALEKEMSDDLLKAWGGAKKFKGKTVKPAKRKAKKKSMAERLQQQQ